MTSIIVMIAKCYASFSYRRYRYTILRNKNYEDDGSHDISYFQMQCTLLKRIK